MACQPCLGKCGWPKGELVEEKAGSQAVRIWTGQLLETKWTSRQGPLQTSGEAGQEHRGKIRHRDSCGIAPREVRSAVKGVWCHQSLAV